MKKIELRNVTGGSDPCVETLGCRVIDAPSGAFTVRRCGASDEAWEAVKERLFGDPHTDLPDGVAVASDGRMYAPGDVVRNLPDAEWEWRPWTAGSWYDSPNVGANDECFYELRRRPSPRTERVAWSWAPGRRKPEGERIHIALPHGGDAAWDTSLVHAAGDQGLVVVSADPDGMVTVLAEDGPR